MPQKAEVICVGNYLEAARDAGYSSPATAICELIDNSIEAGASRIEVDVCGGDEATVNVVDDGAGIPRTELTTALQIGGSSRFGSRQGLGRFGVGLPLAPLSQCRSVEVLSWTTPDKVWASRLNLDAPTELGSLSVARITGLEKVTKSGTHVKWTSCDRLTQISQRGLAQNLQRECGRVYRRFLETGLELEINGVPVQPIDPLCLSPQSDISAKPFGPPIDFHVPLSGGNHGTIRVQFSQLPVEKFAYLSNAEKRQYGITRATGVSVLRANREISSGWHFTGTKRRENYDDWWRCEIAFEPVLDELFGVSTTKQGIRPTPELTAVLTPTIEATARRLNREVREAHASLKSSKIVPITKKARQLERFLPEPKTEPASGLIRNYARAEKLDSDALYDVSQKSSEITVNLNHAIFRELEDRKDNEAMAWVMKILVAAGRAERHFGPRTRRIKEFRAVWGRYLAALLR